MTISTNLCGTVKQFYVLHSNKNMKKNPLTYIFPLVRQLQNCMYFAREIVFHTVN